MKKEMRNGNNNGLEMLAAMNELPEELVELLPMEEVEQRKMAEQGAGSRKKMAKRMKWAIAAACSLCLVGGSVVFAASRLNWYITDHVDPNHPEDDMSDYHVEYMVEQVSADAFTGPVRDVENVFLEEAANGIYPAKDSLPRGWVKECDTAQETIDYIGFEGLRETALPDWEEWKNDVVAYGNHDGKLAEVVASNLYRVGEKISAGVEAEIYTENWDFSTMGDGMPFYKTDEVQGQEYVTKSGKTGLLMVPKYDGEGGYTMKGYMIDGAVVYSLRLIYNSGKDVDERGLAEDAVTKVMYEWMEQF